MCHQNISEPPVARPKRTKYKTAASSASDSQPGTSTGGYTTRRVTRAQKSKGWLAHCISVIASCSSPSFPQNYLHPEDNKEPSDKEASEDRDEDEDSSTKAPSLGEYSAAAYHPISDEWVNQNELNLILKKRQLVIVKIVSERQGKQPFNTVWSPRNSNVSLFFQPGSVRDEDITLWHIGNSVSPSMPPHMLRQTMIDFCKKFPDFVQKMGGELLHGKSPEEWANTELAPGVTPGILGIHLAAYCSNSTAALLGSGRVARPRSLDQVI